MLHSFDIFRLLVPLLVDSLGTSFNTTFSNSQIPSFTVPVENINPRSNVSLQGCMPWLGLQPH